MKLSYFRWERMLLAFVKAWAKLNGFEEIRVIRGEKQAWCYGRTEKFHLLYNVTARREGFQLGEKFHTLTF